MGIENLPLYIDIHNFIENREYPKGTNKNDGRTIHRLAMHFIIYGGKLYRRSYNGIQLLCMDEDSAKAIINEVYQGIYGPHMNKKMLAKKILRLGYY